MPPRREPLASLLVSDLMRRHPETISVFVRNRMACPGCPVAPFETLADVMRAYGLRPARFLGELRAAIRGAGSASLPPLRRSPRSRADR
jgi:hybrid cluster-associated redox disulfide protein